MGTTPISVQARDSVEAALQYEMGRGFVTGSKLFFALDVLRVRASSVALDVRNGKAGRKSRNTFHTARHDLRTIESRSQSTACWRTQNCMNISDYCPLPPLTLRRIASISASMYAISSGDGFPPQYTWRSARQLRKRIPRSSLSPRSSRANFLPHKKSLRVWKSNCLYRSTSAAAYALKLPANLLI